MITDLFNTQMVPVWVVVIWLGVTALAVFTLIMALPVLLVHAAQ